MMRSSCRCNNRLHRLHRHVSAAAVADGPPSGGTDASAAEQKEAALRAEAASWEGVSTYSA
jgi:hypothetical protein